VDEPDLEEYQAAAQLRTALRAFTRRSEQLARTQGLTPQQYLLLLLIKGAPDGSERANVTDLSRRLQLGQSTVTELVHRAEAAGFVERRPSRHDARVSWLSLTQEGNRRLAAVVSALGPQRRRLVELLSSLEHALGSS
jgi:DNA-binding MarR family transcriptional regulator